jgi:hypothetical protein
MIKKANMYKEKIRALHDENVNITREIDASQAQASLPKIITEKLQHLLASFFTPRVPSDFF